MHQVVDEDGDVGRVGAEEGLAFGHKEDLRHQRHPIHQLCQHILRITPGALYLHPLSKSLTLLVAPLPPSLDARMSVLEKLDNWGKHALRNMLADGPMHAPFTTWSLAAHSSAELASWLDGFASVLGGDKVAPSPDSEGSPIGHAARGAHTPVPMQTEEVM